MAHLQPNYYHILKAFSSELSSWKYRGKTHLDISSSYYSRNRRNARSKKMRTFERSVRNQYSTSSSSSIQSSEEEVSVDTKIEMDVMKYGDRKGLFGHLVNENGWQVRRMTKKEDEMREVAHIQAEAFHEPSIFFNDLFFQFFQAEVLAGLLYRLRNSPPDRYACLVAEPTVDTTEQVELQLVGVVDVTVLNDKEVLQYLSKADEYLYISGIAVLQSFRRKKVATVLLKACEMLAIRWGFEYLALRAYEDDQGARNLYTNAGYRMVSGDPPWTTTWIGRRRRVLMIKQSNILT